MEGGKKRKAGEFYLLGSLHKGSVWTGYNFDQRSELLGR